MRRAPGASESHAWHVNTTLAIYEALIQANVPAPAARRAAEALEADMTQHLATKQDLAHTGELLMQRFVVIDQRFAAMDQRFVAIDQRFAVIDQRFAAIDQRFDTLERRIDARFAAADVHLELKLQTLESRIVVKLGALMTFLLAAASAVLALVQ
jgi:hypothetical protein